MRKDKIRILHIAQAAGGVDRYIRMLLKYLDKEKFENAKSVIHDYFIAKSLDLVRPGGVVAVVTSSGTMDKKDSSVREYLSNRADLVGAIRLPNNAFQRNANTGVVADILFLQKRDRAAVERAEWVDLGETPEGYSINQYFAKHPEMVLGKITTESTQYGKQETTVKPIEGADLAKQLKEAVGNIQATITEPEISDDELDVQEESIPADPSVKNFSFTNVDGQIVNKEEYKEFSHSFNEKVETIRKAKAEMNRQRDCLNNLDVEHLPFIMWRLSFLTMKKHEISM